MPALPLDQALERFDAAVLTCPFSRTPSPARNEACPQCGATRLEACAEQARAAFDVVASARALTNPNGRTVQ
jgi:hypothetical protein